MIGDIINLITANGAVSAYVDTRVYPVHVAQDVQLPAVAVTITDNTPNHTKTDTSYDDFVELDVKVFARSALESWNVANAIRAVLDNYTGTAGTTTILACRFEGFNMSHYPPDDTYETTTEYTVHHRRS